MRLDHLVFPVVDLGASLRFYRDALGFAVGGAIEGDDWGGYPWLMALLGVGDGRQIVLVGFRGMPAPAPRVEPEDSRHVAFAVSPAEQATWKTRLEQHDIAWREEDHGTQRSIYFTDPDGLVLEITAPPTAELAPSAEDAPAVIARWLAR